MGPGTEGVTVAGGQTSAAAGVMLEPAPPMRASSEIEEQGNAIEHVEAALSQLEDRLGFALRNVPMIDVDEIARAVETGASDLTTIIARHTTQLWRLKDRIHRVIDRLDL